MLEKMTLEQFNELKNKCQKLIEDAEKYYEENKGNPEYNEDEYVTKFAIEYLKLQDQLLSYDLSDISFEAWEGLSILSNKDYIADFSKTNANIDFKIFDINGNGNFKSCNIKNLDILKEILNPNYFDESVVKNNPNMFLSDSFSIDFKNKLYKNELTMKDFASLSESELKELDSKNKAVKFFSSIKDEKMVESLGLSNMIGLYKYSKSDYEIVRDVLNLSAGYGLVKSNNLSEELKSVPVENIKEVCYSKLREDILNSLYSELSPDRYPKKFVLENDNIFKINIEMPEDLRKRYYERKLTMEDLEHHYDLFDDVPIDNFITGSIDYISTKINEKLGAGSFQKIYRKHSNIIKYIHDEDIIYIIYELLVPSDDIEESFTEAIKTYVSKYFKDQIEFTNENGEKYYKLPEWLDSLNLSIVKKYNTLEEIKKYNSSIYIIDEAQRLVISTFGLQNLLKFESETNFLSHKAYDWSSELESLEPLGYLLKQSGYNQDSFINIYFKNGNMPYSEFENALAVCFEIMRNHNIFTDYPDYDWMDGEFREKYPEIFMSKDAPSVLREAFYKNKITPQLIKSNKNYIKYLLDKDVASFINGSYETTFTDKEHKLEDNTNSFIKVNFAQFYCESYGKEEFLKLLSQYGVLCDNFTAALFDFSMSKEEIDKEVRNTVYKKILSDIKLPYEDLLEDNNKLFIQEHPDIFLDSELCPIENEIHKNDIIERFYKRELKFEDIYRHPELIDYLKDKNLFVAFGRYQHTSLSSYNSWVYRNQGTNRMKNRTELDLIAYIGSENFLKLCSSYGRYLEKLNDSVDLLQITDYQKLCSKVEKGIEECALNGTFSYHPSDVPEFLKNKHPEIFLSDDAPLELKEVFYGGMTFELLKNNKDWLEFLKDKSVVTSFLKTGHNKQYIKEYFVLFGQDKALQLGIQKTETVETMIKSRQVELMKSWYDKTGKKFIPDFVVMQTFPIEKADKFLLAGSNWSSLMRIKSFAKTEESRDAMLKLAYSFGVFDNDQVGYKKLKELLTGLPRTISSNFEYIMQSIYSYEALKNAPEIGVFKNTPGYKQYLELKNVLKSEGFEVNKKEELFSQIYRQNESGNYTLTINPQNFPKSTGLIREIFEVYPDSPILNPIRAHQLFGGFDLKYDKDFREFLLTNLDSVLENPEYSTYVASIQKQFAEIKAANSNRSLTWDLAMSYVQSNKYTSVEVGNEKVAVISAIAGYTQEEFDTLQQIYNYGKQRTFSSIPKIENKHGDYQYEMLRLDDPLAMAIGTLTDCCQELGNVAEICMEHSMVDKNGRVFVIRDEIGNIVAQSWVWRNKDVLCFDNIEIPDKAFLRAQKANPELGRKGLSDEVYEIYKKAAEDLIKEDEKTYKKMLDEGKITEEQYKGLRLGKITVGLGYNDIAQSLKENSELDKGRVSNPLHFEEPVKLSRGLYINDSAIQYVLEERKDRKEFVGETLPIYNDIFIEYNDKNFSEKEFLTLEKLELITKQDPDYLETSVSEYDDNKNLVSAIAHNYGLNPGTARIIMNANLAIIYDVNGDKVRIGDLLYNTKIENNNQEMNIEKAVKIQLKLALDQITKDKQIDISSLNEKQIEMYSKAANLNEQIDNERGVKYGR